MYKLIGLFMLVSYLGIGCECPSTQLNSTLLQSYDIIFKGRVINIQSIPGAYKEAEFEIESLFKGASSKTIKVLIDTTVNCARPILRGQIWLIYSCFKQWQRPLLDWCSRSRQWFEFEKEDFYTFTRGVSFEEEINYLKSRLGSHPILSEPIDSAATNRNILPKPYLLLILLGLSTLGLLVLNYFLKRMFK